MLKLLLLSLVFYGPGISGLSIPILSSLQDIVGLANDIGSIVSGNAPFLSIFTGKKPDPVQEKLDGLSKQIEALSSAFNIKMDNALTQILTNVPRETDFRIRMGQLGSYMARISFLFDTYEKIVKTNHSLNELTIEQFTGAATSLHEGDIIETLNQMHRLYTGRQDDATQGSLMQLAAPVYASMPIYNLCGRPISRQQSAYDLHRTVVITEIKGFIMTSYAYGLLTIYRNSSFTEEIRLAEKRLITRVSDYIRATQIGLGAIPRDVYVCDPDRHSFGKTFVHLFRAIQLTVLQEATLEKKVTCMGSCSKIDTDTINRDLPDTDVVFPVPKTDCQGRITECRDLGDADICVLDTNSQDAVDRVVYVESSSEGNFGNPARCPFGERESIPKTSLIYKSNYCEACMCLCIEENKNTTAIRGFSLRPVVTDLKYNRVMTGIAFERIDKLIWLSIEQGKLIGGGKIQPGTEEWIMLEKFDFESDMSPRGGFSLWNNFKSQNLTEGIDYAFIDYDNRKIEFDDLTVDEPNYVVTGAKLKLSERNPGAIALSIRLNRFNFTTGKLLTYGDLRSPGRPDRTDKKYHSVWVDDDYQYKSKPPRNRTYIDVKNRKDPFKSYGNVPDTEDHSGVELTHSDERDDVGQSTIPYFDRQRAGPMPRVPLDGLGLYHRGNGESGGFISIKTFTFDISKILNPTIDPELMKKVELEDIEDPNELEQLHY